MSSNESLVEASVRPPISENRNKTIGNLGEKISTTAHTTESDNEKLVMTIQKQEMFPRCSTHRGTGSFYEHRLTKLLDFRNREKCLKKERDACDTENIAMSSIRNDFHESRKAQTLPVYVSLPKYFRDFVEEVNNS